MPEKAQYKNFIEVFNTLTERIALAGKGRDYNRLIERLVALFYAHMSKEGQEKLDLMMGDNGEIYMRNDTKALRLVAGDPEIVKLKKFHAGYSELTRRKLAGGEGE